MDAQYYSGWGHLGLRGGRGETLAQQYAMGGGVWGPESGFRVVLRGLLVVSYGFRLAIVCGVGCHNCAELG